MDRVLRSHKRRRHSNININNTHTDEHARTRTTSAARSTSRSTSRSRPRSRPRSRREKQAPSRITNTNGTEEHSDNCGSLTFLGLSRSWRAAEKRARSHPHEATYGCTSSARMPLHLGNESTNSTNNGSDRRRYSMLSSPLAYACRYGAPPDTVRAIVDADTNMVRRCIPNRGTPLHEAVMAYPNLSKDYESSINGNGVGSSSNGDGNSSIDRQYVDTIRMLLEADEQLALEEGRDSSRNCDRATLMQDVDGNVPLHLLVRQAFYNYLTVSSSGTSSTSSTHSSTVAVGAGASACAKNPNNCEEVMKQQEHPLLTIIHELIQSCPEASAKPDCTEFEETPLVLVLKSSIYAMEQSGMDSDDIDTAQLERNIFEMCKFMLHLHPYAASFVSSNKSGYTAVHSAVFHGRCCDTIQLLLEADLKYRKEVQLQLDGKKRSPGQVSKNGSSIQTDIRLSVPTSAAMRANFFGETPLHFATMRGESTRTIDLLSRAAPLAVLQRDVKFGMTPLHWLLARFVDSMRYRFVHTFEEADVDGFYNLNGVSMTETFDFVCLGCGPNDFCTGCGSDYEYDEDGMAILDEQKREAEEMLDRVSKATDPRTIVDLHDGQSKTAGHLSGNRDEFDLEYYRRTRAIDPPVDYMSMRHIVPEHDSLEEILIDRSITVLQRVRAKHKKMMEEMKEEAELNTAASCPFHKGKRNDVRACPFKNDSYSIESRLVSGIEEDAVREEQMVALFWAKVTSLLRAATLAQRSSEIDLSNLSDCASLKMSPTSINDEDEDDDYILHNACAAPTPYAIVRLCLELYPDERHLQDHTGKTPLHHAASRAWDAREFTTALSLSSSDNQSDSNAVEQDSLSNSSRSSSYESDSNAPMIANETVNVFYLVLGNSCVDAAGVLDNEGRNPFHCAIDSTTKGLLDYCSNTNATTSNNSSEDVADIRMTRSDEDRSVYSINNILNKMLTLKPDLIEQTDGRTGLYPFMQVAACATEYASQNERNNEGASSPKSPDNRMSVSLTFSLLLVNPSLATGGLKETTL